MGYVDGVIYLANIENEGLVCYDGNHRRCALMNLPKNYKVIINILENPTFEVLKEKFRSLNICVHVTELFLNPENKDTHQDMLTKIMDVTEYFCSIWKSHRKTSPNPKRPNFNRDSLQSKIVYIIETENKSINELTKE